MQAPDEASRGSSAEQDAPVTGASAGRGGTLSEGSEPWVSPGRYRDIDTRLAAVRVRLTELRRRELDAGKSWAAASPSERVEAAQRHAAEAQAAAAQVLAASAEAFRHAAQAHERAASMHERTAAAGIGDVIGHERQATLHRAAAAADRRRAERVQLLISGHDQAGGAAAVSEESGDGVARQQDRPHRAGVTGRGASRAGEGRPGLRTAGAGTSWYPS